MKALSLFIITFLAILPWSWGYNAYPRSGYAPYAATASASASASVSAVPSCCEPNYWLNSHKDEVNQFADRLRQEYMVIGSGKMNVYRSPWRENIVQLTGKTAADLDAFARQVTEKFVNDLRKGYLNYETFRSSNFFEQTAIQVLQSAVSTAEDFGQQQQEIVDYNKFPSTDLSGYDQVKTYNYPAEVKVIEGRPYVVHTNYTEAAKNFGDGGHIRQLNRTTIATSNTANYLPSYGPPYAQKTTARDWYGDNVKLEVPDYKRVWNSYQPAVNIPVDVGLNSDAETISSGRNYLQPVYNNGGSTVTVHHYNKTIIRNLDGTDRQYGSELNRKWVDGKLVYDSEHPFGEWTVPRGEAWKCEERERLFWLLNPSTITTERLEAWQHQQEERLIGVAERYHTTVDEIKNWHRQEFERYRALLGQYQSQTTDLKGWQRAERGRLDWLIHQNSVTREDLERWQRENLDKINQLAAQYRISVQDYNTWQIEELNRIYAFFNNQNNSMISPRPFNAEALRTNEQARLDELIRQHNATMEKLQNSIKNDQQKLAVIAQNYRGSVQDMEKWLQNELMRLKSEINEQHNKMESITSWQRTERDRLENILKLHRGSVNELENQMAKDQTYMQTLAAKYKVSIVDLENWQRAELQRLQNEGQQQFNQDVQDWQRRAHEQLTLLVKKNDLTIEEFQAQVLNDKERLQQLANTYKVQVSEIEEWIRKEIKNFQTEGVLKEVRKELELWQQKEREHIQSIVKQNALTIEELEAKIKNDQTHLFTVANKYQVGVEEVEQWLKQELMRLQSEGLVKVEDLEEWQKHEREDILQIVQLNKLTIEEFEKKLLSDKERLANLASSYNIQTSEIESWIKKEGERLQNLGMLQIREELNNWQQIERQRLLNLVNKNNLTLEELEEKINKDQVHLYSLAQQHQVRVEEIEDWIKAEIKKLQQEGLLEMEKLKGWQQEWRGNLTNMVKERDFTVEEFHKWLLEDRNRLQALATQHNVQIEEIEQWIHNEEQRFVSMGLLKQNEKLTNWQEVERRYLERITEEQFHSTEQLEQRLRQDRELLQKLALDYSVQVEEVEQWTKKELARLRDEGQLQIDNLNAWQIAERERLEELIKQNKQWSVEEFESELRKDREHMQRTAFQYHTSVEEIDKWLKSEVNRLQAQGKLNIENLNAWQKAEHKRILNLLQQQSSVTSEEFEQRIQKDSRFITNLSNEHNVGVTEIETYVKQVLEDLRAKGRFELENLQSWQIVERDYIKQLINEHKTDLTTEQYKQQLLNDRVHIQQLSQQFHVNVEEIEKWMIDELKRLRLNSEDQVRKLAAWQRSEVLRLKELIKQNNHLSYVGFEAELLKERERLQIIAKQYSLSVEEIENWLRQQLVNLKTTGEIEVENLTQWQTEEQKRLIGLLLEEQKNVTETEFDAHLHQDQSRLQELSQKYSVRVEEIENWMRDELKRLKESGLLQVEQLNQWQQQERKHLEDWLHEQQHVASYEDFNAFLKNDAERLQNIAREYQVTVEQVESWVKQEGARLQLLGQIKPPQNQAYIYHWESGFKNVEDIWKSRARDHLKYFVDIGRVHNLADVEHYLTTEQQSLRNIARQNDITVEQVEFWLRQEAQNFVKQGIIQAEVTEESWMKEERVHIEELINKHTSQWSIEELLRQLVNDRQHLQQIANIYHRTIEDIEIWYKTVLQDLLNRDRINSEHLVDWQSREKDRLYRIVVHQPGLTVENLKTIVLKDRNTLNHLADVYHVNIEELELWIKNEINRLRDLGYVSEISNARQWQEEERKRLRDIANEIVITEYEIFEFISSDAKFQQELADSYNITLSQLAPVQAIEIVKMRNEGLFDKTQLLKLKTWQKIERDRLYTLIKTMNFNLKNLQNWQRQETLLGEFARKYGLTVQELKDWQLNEYERLLKIADHYRMSRNQLQKFREQELNHIAFVMHKKLISEEEYANWASEETKRTAALERKSGFSGEELLVWRRKLYLLSQGLIPLDFGGYGGHEIGHGTTNRTAMPHHEISRDRGDQPPVVNYDEYIDEPEVVEPYVPPTVPVSTERIITYPGPIGRISTQGGYRYTKTETKYNVPLSGIVENSEGVDKRSLNDGQQQQQEEIEDFGQQEQVDLGWNGKLTNKEADLGQQQVEEFSYTPQHGQQQQMEDFGQQQVQVEEFSGPQLSNGRNGKQLEATPSTTATLVEVKAEPQRPGFFERIKNTLG